MIVLDEYTVNPSLTGMPQKVASEFSALFDKEPGVVYEFIAYLGSKSVDSGTNHAVLAKQTLSVDKAKDVLVLIVLNEKSGDVRGESIALEEIGNLISQDDNMNIIYIPEKDLDDSMKAYFTRYKDQEKKDIKMLALVATKFGTNSCYIFLTEYSNLTTNPKDENDIKDIHEISLVGVYTTDPVKGKSYTILTNQKEEPRLGYAFGW